MTISLFHRISVPFKVEAFTNVLDSDVIFTFAEAIEIWFVLCKIHSGHVIHFMISPILNIV